MSTRNEQPSIDEIVEQVGSDEESERRKSAEGKPFFEYVAEFRDQ